MDNLEKENFPQEITLLLKKIDEMPNAAMEGIWEYFFERLVQRAKLEISNGTQRIKDEEDVAIETMNSFYKGLKAGRFDEIENRDELWRLLVTIAARKAKRLFRDAKARKRGGGEVRGESVFLKSNSSDGRGIENAAVDRKDQFADIVFQEMLDSLNKLEDQTLRLIAQRRLEGYTITEIADELKVVPRTVDRKIKRIRTLWD